MRRTLATILLTTTPAFAFLPTRPSFLWERPSGDPTRIKLRRCVFDTAQVIAILLTEGQGEAVRPLRARQGIRVSSCHYARLVGEGYEVGVIGGLECQELPGYGTGSCLYVWYRSGRIGSLDLSAIMNQDSGELMRLDYRPPSPDHLSVGRPFPHGDGDGARPSRGEPD